MVYPIRLLDLSDTIYPKREQNIREFHTLSLPGLVRILLVNRED